MWERSSLPIGHIRRERPSTPSAHMARPVRLSPRTGLFAFGASASAAMFPFNWRFSTRPGSSSMVSLTALQGRHSRAWLDRDGKRKRGSSEMGGNANHVLAGQVKTFPQNNPVTSKLIRPRCVPASVFSSYGLVHDTSPRRGSQPQACGSLVRARGTAAGAPHRNVRDRALAPLSL